MIHDAPGDLLRKIVEALETARIPHMVVGSFASTSHGEPRTTRDLEMDVPTATAEDTIIAKLEWAKRGASDRQLEDVAGILRVRGADLAALDEQRELARGQHHDPAIVTPQLGERALLQPLCGARRYATPLGRPPFEA